MSATGCLALGCRGDTLVGKALCQWHLRALPKAMRSALSTPGGLRGALAYLGKRDGYLTDVTPRASAISEAEGGGRGYV